MSPVECPLAVRTDHFSWREWESVFEIVVGDGGEKQRELMDMDKSGVTDWMGGSREGVQLEEDTEVLHGGRKK